MSFIRLCNKNGDIQSYGHADTLAFTAWNPTKIQSDNRVTTPKVTASWVISNMTAFRTRRRYKSKFIKRRLFFRLPEINLHVIEYSDLEPSIQRTPNCTESITAYPKRRFLRSLRDKVRAFNVLVRHRPSSPSMGLFYSWTYASTLCRVLDNFVRIVQDIISYKFLVGKPEGKNHLTQEVAVMKITLQQTLKK
jgi:hypothetical protein